MATDYSRVFRVTWSGTLHGSDEIFSYNQHIGYNGLDPDAKTLIADEAENHVAALLTQSVTAGPFLTMAGAFPSHVEWTKFKLAEISLATGKYLVAEVPIERVRADVGTGATGLGLPNQVAHSVTIRSGVRGRRIHNRWYLPPYCQNATDGLGHVIQPVIDALGTHQHFIMTALAAAVEEAQYCNFSLADHAGKITLDSYIGNVLDTIRRRRNKLIEARTIHSLP